MRDVLSCRSMVNLISAALLLGCVGPTRADPLRPTITYDTSMTIGAQGITGTPVVGFQGISGGTVLSPIPTQPGAFADPIPAGYGSDIPLGEFTLTMPPAGTTTTYRDTPFRMTFTVDSVGGAPGAHPSSFTVQGVLNGTIGNPGASDLKAAYIVLSTGTRFLPDFEAGGFATSRLNFVLTIPDNLSSLEGSATPVSGVLVSAESAPEPSTLWIFLALALGPLGWRRFRATTGET
jgi:hypothetical protein